MVSALYPLSSLQCLGYHVLSMSIEMNTAFLHARTILLMSGWPRYSPPVRVAVALNIVSFLLFRFVPLYFCTEAIFLHYREVPVWFAVLFTASMIVLNCINVILFYRILRTDFFRDSSRSLSRRYFGGIDAVPDHKSGGGPAGGGPSPSSDGDSPASGLSQMVRAPLDRLNPDRNSKNLCDSLDLDEEARLPRSLQPDSVPSSGQRVEKRGRGNRSVSPQQENGTRLRGSVIRDVDEQLVQVTRSLSLRM